MDKQIRIVDVETGVEAERGATTLTLDVPPDFDRAAREMSVDADSLGHYASRSGQQRILFVRPSPLSRRAQGERCLIAGLEVDASGASCRRSYRLSEIAVSKAFEV